MITLTLYKQYFDWILEGKKKEEARVSKSYWWKRLFDENGLKHDKIKFVNGYGNHRPWMIVECLGYEIDDVDKIIYLELGKILDKGNIMYGVQPK